MALIQCPECKKQVSENADNCPNCGYKLTPEVKATIKAKQIKSKKTNRIFWLSMIVIIIVAIVVKNQFVEEQPEIPWEKVDDSIGAYIMAETFVKKSLKSPSTAVFPKDVLFKKDNVTRLGGQKYRISYYVDSQNSFGAMIRTNFVAEVEKYEEDMWRLLSLEFDE